MQIFESLLTVSEDDLDDLDHVNNVRYVQWVNDVAKAHWEQNTSETLRQQYFWVVLSHHIDYKASALLGDTILLKTYVTRSEGVTSTRVVEIYNNATNTLLAKSETNWCFMSVQTKRPTRITEEVAQLFN